MASCKLSSRSSCYFLKENLRKFKSSDNAIQNPFPMKKLRLSSLLLFVCLSFFSFPIASVFGQSPQGLNYQAVARNGSGVILQNQNIGIRFTITDGQGGPIIYQETQSTVSNQFGLITLNVGSGIPGAGSFSSIPWASITPWLQVEMDADGGTAYVSMGTSPLLSVPYALFAASGNQGPQGMEGPQGPPGVLPNGSAAGNTPYWNGASWIINSSNIYNNGANVGINTSTPAATAVLELSSADKGLLPPRMTLLQRNAIASPAQGLIIYCIDNPPGGEPEFFNGTIWKNMAGNAADIFYPIGHDYLGGKIAYILQPGDPGYIEGEYHGLIAAASDLSTAAPWGCQGINIGGTSTDFGTGNANTIAIVNGCDSTGIAARICNDLVLNGYSDWYLPSKDELNKLYLNKDAIGGFILTVYRSSSEFDIDFAWALHFTIGSQEIYYKDGPGNVRAVRAF